MRSRKITCKDTGETAKTYEDYLKTKHWLLLRQEIAKKYGFICKDCGKSVLDRFEIHHLTYKRVGNEKEDDLVCLCRDCHEARTQETKNKKMRNKELGKASLSEKIKNADTIKKKVNLVLHSNKKVRVLFEKYFDLFLKKLEKLEKGNNKNAL